MKHLVVRVLSKDYATWRTAMEYAGEAILNHGVTGWKVFQETENPNEVLVIFYTTDIDATLEFFKSSDEFKRANAASGAIEREFFIAEKL